MTPADSATVAGRPLRADARRNRARVLEVAQQVFAEEGLAVPIDEIARRAGVGVGTVYRHFPTKDALFEAIIVERLCAVGEAARELARRPGAGRAFFGFFDDVTGSPREEPPADLSVFAFFVFGTRPG